MKRIFVTGAAGFIGSNLVDTLLARGFQVTGYDNFSTGQREFLKDALAHDSFSLVEGDTLDSAALSRAMSGVDFVFHFAANADVRHGASHPERDLKQNTIATFNVLEAMRANSVRRMAFSSTGSIYGEPTVFPTPEDAPFPLQTSLYGASKLAGEGLIQAYCENFGYQAVIFRFVSILGARYSHGHVFDFYRQLREHPGYLDVLGDGAQSKSYLEVTDCIAAMFQTSGLFAPAPGGGGCQIYNLGCDSYCTVKDSIRWITEHLGISPELKFSGGKRGWIGDSPFILLDAAKVRKTGWKPAFSIREGIVRTLEWLQANTWIFENRCK